MGRANDLRRLIALAEQLRGPMMQQVQQVQNAVARRGDPDVQLERKRARLARRQAWAARWLTFWSLITAVFTVMLVSSFTGLTDDPNHDAGWGAIIIVIISTTLAVRAGLRMRRFGRERKALGGDTGPASVRPAQPAVAPLPPKSSLARQPMERLADAESTLAELLVQIERAGSVPAESIEHTRRTGVDAAQVLRRFAAQLIAVERARDHSPPLERGALANAVRSMRNQLDEGVDGYGSLVAAAGRVLAASSLSGNNSELTDATEHLAGLALALRDLAPENG